ncbi:helix-turn-helix domain-containing protein [Priestia koreensis]|uniref:helix-turn-helix domain-containing protein n=1 Tax=Priestia koreensis TaxID=284581 RepID=UPI00203B4026|nr:helix-turn-helix domain-containing protein [Priestia koreensis]MCM3004936.1 helix-turn-helix domain-containing protein [Priestia koreensis]
MYKNIEEYPFILTAAHISEILMVSKPTAYELMEQTSFPLIRIGRIKRVRKDEFFNWLTHQQASNL